MPMPYVVNAIGPYYIEGLQDLLTNSLTSLDDCCVFVLASSRISGLGGHGQIDASPLCSTVIR